MRQRCWTHRKVVNKNWRRPTTWWTSGRGVFLIRTLTRHTHPVLWRRWVNPATPHTYLQWLSVRAWPQPLEDIFKRTSVEGQWLNTPLWWFIFKINACVDLGCCSPSSKILRSHFCKTTSITKGHPFEMLRAPYLRENSELFLFFYIIFDVCCMSNTCYAINPILMT